MILLNVSIWKSIYQWNSLQVLKNPNQRHVAYCIDNILISQQPVWSNTSDNVFQFCFSDILKLSWKTSFFFFFAAVKHRGNKCFNWVSILPQRKQNSLNKVRNSGQKQTQNASLIVGQLVIFEKIFKRSSKWKRKLKHGIEVDRPTWHPSLCCYASLDLSWNIACSL